MAYGDSAELRVTEVEKVVRSVADQLRNGEEVLVEDQKIRVKRVGSGRLRMVQFRMNGRVLEAIEQNREKPSRWGKLAREKHQVVQFRDVETHKYVAVSVDGEVREYGREREKGKVKRTSGDRVATHLSGYRANSLG